MTAPTSTPATPATTAPRWWQLRRHGARSHQARGIFSGVQKRYTPVCVSCVVKLSNVKRIEFIDRADMKPADILETVTQIAHALYGDFEVIEITETTNAPA